MFVGSIEKGDVAYDQNDAKHQYGAGLTKFQQFMTPVYNKDGTTIYMLPDSGAAIPSQVEAGLGH